MNQKTPKTIEMNSIPVFVAVYEERNLSKAAARLGVSQPAVSKALNRLRAIYNDPIVHRTPSGVEPTRFAHDIYPALSASLQSFNSTLDYSESFDPKTSNKTFAIAAASMVNLTFIPALIEKGNDSDFNLSLEVTSLPPQDPETDLRMQHFDLIIGKSAEHIMSLRSEYLYSLNLRVVCARHHPRITGSTISKEAFLSEKHAVIYGGESGQNFYNDSEFTSSIKRKVTCRLPGSVELFSTVERTPLLGLCSERVYQKMKGSFDVKAMPFPFEDDKTIDIHMVWHPGRSSEPAHKWLRNVIKDTANDFK